ncbi:MAG: polysaccharide biosynthesis C-terminal domain-containing protein, partial [Treponema sp.]|nr:polysaccharide biosynthesis C-terminal domain-containing protein [Treponema sp.]
MTFKTRLGPLNFYHEALSIALPVMLQQLIMSMVSLVDNFMVAGLGDISMAAVNVANQINFIHIVIVNAICGAGGIYLAQFRGAGDEEGMRNAYRFKVVFALGSSLAWFALCRFIPEKMIVLMTMGNAEQERIVPIGAGYLRLVSFTLFPLAFSSCIGSSFREIGHPKIPLVISAAATLINTAGNWVLIYGNLGAPRLEVPGAAFATIIARFAEVGAFFAYVNRHPAPFYSRLVRLFRINPHLVTEILAKS